MPRRLENSIVSRIVLSNQPNDPYDYNNNNNNSNNRDHNNHRGYNNNNNNNVGLLEHQMPMDVEGKEFIFDKLN